MCNVSHWQMPNARIVAFCCNLPRHFLRAQNSGMSHFLGPKNGINPSPSPPLDSGETLEVFVEDWLEFSSFTQFFPPGKRTWQRKIPPWMSWCTVFPIGNGDFPMSIRVERTTSFYVANPLYIANSLIPRFTLSPRRWQLRCWKEAIKRSNSRMCRKGDACVISWGG